MLLDLIVGRVPCVFILTSLGSNAFSFSSNGFVDNQAVKHSLEIGCCDL